MSFQADSPAELALFADYISKYCAKLVDLTISKFASMSDEVFTYDVKSIKNYIAKKLTWLRYIPLGADFVSYMLNRLPNLKTLVFTDFHMESGVCKTPSILPTRLPHTISFDSIEINMNSSLLTTTFNGMIYCIKVITEEEEKISRCCFLRVYDSEEHINSYSEVKKPFLKKEEVTTFAIYCRSVKKLSVKYTAEEDGVRKQINL